MENQAPVEAESGPGVADANEADRSCAVSYKDSPQSVLNLTLFAGLHAICLLAFVCGVSTTAIIVCVVLYVVRMFAITAGYHRYFSHHAFKTSRAFQFVLGFLGTSTAQKGPLWWASHHRHHHRYSDTARDVHPPHVHGAWWAHVGWILSAQFTKPRKELVRDLTRYPELCWLDRYHLIPPILLALSMYLLGQLLQHYFPGLGTNGFQLFIWGFCISTVLLYHGTFAVNSWGHIIGKKRFETGDHSKNSFLLALFTLGEGWHNNHHRYPGSVRQGFYWWEIDVSHYILIVLSWFGIVWDLRSPPERIYAEARELKG